MMLPPWLAAVAILFWGVCVGAWFVAAPLALLLAAPLFVAHRLDLQRPEFHRAGDVCWVLGFGGLLLLYSQEDVGNLLRAFARWLPLVAVPALLAQFWSTHQRVPTSALLPWPAWRRREADANPPLDLGAAFVVACLLSASVAGGGRPWFYAGLVLVVGALLWLRRPATGRAGPALALLLAAGLGGWFTANGLAGVQQWIETGMAEWTTRFQRERSPHRESRTAIGRTGRVGGSSRVILRLRDEGPRPMPPLLRMANYSAWDGDTWYGLRGGFEKVEGAADEWMLDVRARVAGAVHVEWSRAATRGLVPIPGSTRALRDLSAESVEKTALGSVRVRINAGVVSFLAEHAVSADWEAEPGDKEGHPDGVPTLERPAIEAIVEDLRLRDLPASERVARVRDFFRTHFRYTLDLVDTPAADPRAKTPLGSFLLGHRSGHCEYFATAAVLVLRAAGVPARYATGFLVDPDQKDGDVITVRESQAHAWARVFVEGAWRDFDPTPPTDLLDAEASGWAARWGRRWNEMRFALARWWWLGEKRLLRQAHWLAIPLLAALLWRFRRLRAAGRNAGAPAEPAVFRGPGLDSEWYALESALGSRGWAPREQESMSAWTLRLAAVDRLPFDTDRAVAVRRLHQRLRFDPRGLGDDERAALRASAGEILAALDSPGGSPKGGAAQMAVD